MRSVELEALYRNRFSDGERAAKVRLWAVLYRSFFSRYVPAGGVVLDLGAGYCDLINQVTGAARRIAVDLNPATRAHASSGVEVHEIEFARLAEVVPPESVDVAFASNVFEHLRSPDALLAALAAVRTALRIGGRIVILQPNIRHVGAAFWDYFDHTLPLTEKGMSEALTMAGFRVVETRSRFLPYTVKSRLPSWDWTVRAYLLARPLQWWLGKQMLVVAEKIR